MIRRSRLTESSLIVSWISPEFGLFKTACKGALRPKSKQAGILDLFHLCEIQFVNSRSSDLHSLREVSLSNPFLGITSSYNRIALASYAIELLCLSTESETPVPELFSLFLRLLNHLNTNPASPKALLHFEAELTRILGISSPSIPPILSLERFLHRLPKDRVNLVSRLALPSQT